MKERDILLCKIKLKASVNIEKMSTLLHIFFLRYMNRYLSACCYLPTYTLDRSSEKIKREQHIYMLLLS